MFLLAKVSRAPLETRVVFFSRTLRACSGAFWHSDATSRDRPALADLLESAANAAPRTRTAAEALYGFAQKRFALFEHAAGTPLADAVLIRISRPRLSRGIYLSRAGLFLGVASRTLGRLGRFGS